MMDTKKKLIIIATILTIVAFGALSCATTGGGTKISLKATKMHQGASGTTSISDEHLSINANGLKANSVYTVWFVNMDENMKPKAHVGAGMAPYMFKTDSSGAGTYESRLKASPFGEWQMMMIMLHPSGDPTNMDNMVGALSAKLMK
jgi:hypothetical protein